MAMNVLAVLFSFGGRIGRGQYWLGYFVQLALAALSWMCLLTAQRNGNIPLLIVPVILCPLVLWMALAVMAKRYHDRGKSAWWILIAFVPIVGGIWQLIELGLLRGTEGANDYGPDPAHSFDVADDIEALRRQSGYRSAPTAPAVQSRAVAAVLQPRSPYTDGRPVFGKRF
ncbi:MAG: DUF805 domain-containing protein [Parvibaculaceae bacterium]